MSAPDWLTARPIAHRGLHGPGLPENSLGAFEAAIEGGFAIECDLQPAEDGTPMVFHDPVLGRLTGEDGRVDGRNVSELTAMRLAGTNERVPTLPAMLELVADRVPIVLELKGPQADPARFVRAVAEALAGYGGRAALMSFDHDLARMFGADVPDRPRGLTAEGGDEAFDAHTAIYGEADLSFVSYHVDALPCRFVSQVRGRGDPAITWTVRTPEQVATTMRHADQMTFEGFIPSP